MNRNAVNPTAALELARQLQRGLAPQAAWLAFEQALRADFGHRLCTMLAYDPGRQLLRRLHSNRPDINPPGGAKRVTQSAWKQRVLDAGEFYVGSTATDIASVFSEHALLVANGCESVLNIPVRCGDEVVGTLNLLDAPHTYDAADLGLASLYGQMAAGLMLRARAGFSDDDLADAALERV